MLLCTINMYFKILLSRNFNQKHDSFAQMSFQKVVFVPEHSPYNFFEIWPKTYNHKIKQHVIKYLYVLTSPYLVNKGSSIASEENKQHTSLFRFCLCNELLFHVAVWIGNYMCNWTKCTPAKCSRRFYIIVKHFLVFLRLSTHSQNA